ncbi:MAG: beta-lactamase family protein [Planctomycetes bacterium]|nr:beta-lactamase family protein [Planctomycetota bacterium]
MRTKAILVAWCLAAAAVAQKAKPTLAGEAGERLDAIVRAFDAAAGGFSGSVLVARDGKVLLEQGYGVFDAAARAPMPVDALWDWASVSKQFTAAALLRLQDKKKVRLDDVLKKHWPATPEDKHGVTVRMLLQHTSGIEAGFRDEWRFDSRRRSSLEELVLGRPMTSAPGAEFDYSNSGYALAAALVEKLSGTAFEKFCVHELFRPAGMKDAGFIGWPQLDPGRVPKVRRGEGFADRPADVRFAYGHELTWGYRGSGGVVASTADMLAWDRALRTGKLLSKQALAEFYRPAKQDYALGLRVPADAGGRRVEHSGYVEGVATCYVRLLEPDVVVALACNYEAATDPATLAQQLLDAAAH